MTDVISAIPVAGPLKAVGSLKDIAPKKKIIICCDGTWYSENFARPLTNVSRISRSIRPVYQGDVYGDIAQVVYYQPGVGTGTSKAANLVEGVTGQGLYHNILEAYSFLCHNYTRSEDEIFLIGFSRGAFTARCVAQLVFDVGLLTKAGLFNLLELFNLWKKQIKPRSKESLKDRCSKLVGQGLLRPGVRIRACAVWDSVSSLGLPMIAGLPQPMSYKLKFVGSDLCPNIDKAFQALSLHERRRQFHPIVWRLPENGSTTLKQCWFLGYHGDIGGGKKVEGLAYIPLVWLMSQLSDELAFDPATLWQPPSKRTCWSVTPSANGLSFKVRAKDTLKGIFTLGGAKYRRPRCYFWGPRGVSYEEPSTSKSVSQEMMHFTVHLLLNKSVVLPCKPLARASYDSKKASWTFPGRPREYEVVEDEMRDFEFDQLDTWFGMEMKKNENKDPELQEHLDKTMQTLRDYVLQRQPSRH